MPLKGDNNVIYKDDNSPAFIDGYDYFDYASA